MKKIILISVLGLFISCKEVKSDNEPYKKGHEFRCEMVNGQFERCENDEVICYGKIQNRITLSCVQKTFI